MKGVSGALLVLAILTSSSHAQGPPRPLPRTELIMLTGSESATRRGMLIEDRHRLSPAYRWRDRCLTVALLGVWWHPVDAIRHVIASEAFRWNVFVTDLGGVLTVTGAAVALTLGWGTYGRLCGGRRVPQDPDALLGRPRIDPAPGSMSTADAGIPSA